MLATPNNSQRAYIDINHLRAQLKTSARRWTLERYLAKTLNIEGDSFYLEDVTTLMLILGDKAFEALDARKPAHIEMEHFVLEILTKETAQVAA